MSPAGAAGAAAWALAMHDAIAIGDEVSYRDRWMQLLGAPDGAAYVGALARRPVAAAMMQRSFQALASPMGLLQPTDLVDWLSRDRTRLVATHPASHDVVTVALPYLRFARDWAQTSGLDASFGVDVALMFFEPVLRLCDARGTPAH